jgi:riboflavin kinase/FMN adenylyltransferase
VGVQRFSGLDAVPAGFGPSVVTIGNFDGVHRGHQAVLRRVVAQARARGLAAVAVTFDPHPVAVLFPERAPGVLTTLEHRLDLLAATGLDAVLVLEFTREFAQWSPERFVREAFVEALHAAVVIVGRDTRFGHKNSGDVGTLRELGERYGFTVDVLEDLGAADGGGRDAGTNDNGTSETGVSENGTAEKGTSENGAARRWSSTWVRELLAAGEVARAAEVLGRPHRVTGVVVHGDHRGRELGYPTANLAQDSLGQVPADGVYAGRLIRLGLAPDAPDAVMPAAVSVGTNPTFDGVQRRVEAYVLDRDDLDLYGETVGIEFVQRLRPTLRFDGVDALVEQMAQDVDRSREVLGVHGVKSEVDSARERTRW